VLGVRAPQAHRIQPVPSDAVQRASDAAHCAGCAEVSAVTLEGLAPLLDHALAAAAARARAAATRPHADTGGYQCPCMLL
jgi:hypothetical protein